MTETKSWEAREICRVVTPTRMADEDITQSTPCLQISANTLRKNHLQLSRQPLHDPSSRSYSIKGSDSALGSQTDQSKREYLKELCIRFSLGYPAWTMLSYSVNALPVGLSLTIQNFMPIFTLIFAYMMLKEGLKRLEVYNMGLQSLEFSQLCASQRKTELARSI